MSEQGQDVKRNAAPGPFVRCGIPFAALLAVAIVAYIYWQRVDHSPKPAAGTPAPGPVPVTVLTVQKETVPIEMRQGITVVKASSNILGLIALESQDGAYDELYLSNYATINLLDCIKRVPGVDDATVFGNKDYSMRIWINPDRLALKGMTVSDVAAALRDQNAVFPAGTIGQRPTGKEVEPAIPADHL